VLGSLVGEPTREREGASLRVADARADAFRRLVDRSLDASHRLAAVILNDRIEAEDAVHDAAVSAWRAFDSLRDELQEPTGKSGTDACLTTPATPRPSP